MNEKVRVEFGPSCDPLHEQCDVPVEVLALEQRMADSIVLLAVHGILSNTERNNAHVRLSKRILERLRQHYGIKPKKGKKK